MWSYAKFFILVLNIFFYEAAFRDVCMSIFCWGPFFGAGIIDQHQDRTQDELLLYHNHLNQRKRTSSKNHDLLMTPMTPMMNHPRKNQANQRKRTSPKNPHLPTLMTPMMMMNLQRKNHLNQRKRTLPKNPHQLTPMTPTMMMNHQRKNQASQKKRTSSKLNQVMMTPPLTKPHHLMMDQTWTSTKNPMTQATMKRPLNQKMRTSFNQTVPMTPATQTPTPTHQTRWL